jgi:hypothetical protein
MPSGTPSPGRRRIPRPRKISAPVGPYQARTSPTGRPSPPGGPDPAPPRGGPGGDEAGASGGGRVAGRASSTAQTGPAQGGRSSAAGSDAPPPVPRPPTPSSIHDPKLDPGRRAGSSGLPRTAPPPALRSRPDLPVAPPGGRCDRLQEALQVPEVDGPGVPAQWLGASASRGGPGPGGSAPGEAPLRHAAKTVPSSWRRTSRFPRARLYSTRGGGRDEARSAGSAPRRRPGSGPRPPPRPRARRRGLGLEEAPPARRTRRRPRGRRGGGPERYPGR